MTPAVALAAILVYFVLIFIISRFSRHNTGGGNFFGNHRTPWLIAAIAAVGAPVSGVTFISVPGMVITKSFSYLEMILGFAVGYTVIAYVLVPLFYRKNLTSIYGYLEGRYGGATHATGAWFFFISKMLGASVRFFVVCIVLQNLLFGPLGIPFSVNVIIAISLIFLYTSQGGVKTVIWTDSLKTLCIVSAVTICIVTMMNALGMNFSSMCRAVTSDPCSRIFFFDDPKNGLFFWKQFIAGIFLVIATNGLDQDMMQRNLSCRNSKEAAKSVLLGAGVQFVIILLFLMLGVLMLRYFNLETFGAKGAPAEDVISGLSGSTDNLFPTVVASKGMPSVAVFLFVLGLCAASYSTAGAALTALTTSFTIDILKADRKKEGNSLDRTRKWVHAAMAICMGAVILVFNAINSQDAISAVYLLASYTYGPILGLFAFGMMCKAPVRDRAVPLICIAAPFLSYALKTWLKLSFGYTVSYELLLINAAFVMVGMALVRMPVTSVPCRKQP